MDEFVLHTLKVLNETSDPDKTLLVLQSAAAEINDCPSLCAEIVEFVSYVLNNCFNASQTFWRSYLNLQPILEKAIASLVDLYGVNKSLSRGFSYERLSALENLNQVASEEKLVWELFNPVGCFLSERDFRQSLINIAKSGAFDLNVTLTNLNAIRLWLLLHYCINELLHKKYSYSIFCPAIADYIGKQKYGLIVEIGCGKGYWAKELSKTGVNVIAQDIVAPEMNNSTNKEGGYFSNILTLPEDSAMLLCWAPKKEVLVFEQYLKWFCGRHLLLVGDDLCGSRSLHKVISSEYTLLYTMPLPRLIGVYDNLKVYERKCTTTKSGSNSLEQ